MATQEVVRDQPPVQLAPVDESVLIPKSVREATERANAVHAQVYTPPEPEQQEQPAEPEQPVVEAAPPEPEAPPPPADPVPTPTREDLNNDTWAGRYNSMKGRWESSQRMIGSLQDQLTQMGDELVRTQQMLHRGPPPPQQPEQPLLTKEDEEKFGGDFIDFAQRAALAAVRPEIDQLRHENQQLKRGVQRTSVQSVYQVLDGAVSNWREINGDPRFNQWLDSRDIYSGAVRRMLLNKAFQAADAPRVVEFFKGFLREEQATGHIDPPPPQADAQPTPAPRQAAVPLAVLAAPGRARPAAGDSVPADKPIFTRKQIAGFYDDVRRGAYSGRETEKVQREAEIFAAQREGRVR